MLILHELPSVLPGFQSQYPSSTSSWSLNILWEKTCKIRQERKDKMQVLQKSSRRQLTVDVEDDFFFFFVVLHYKGLVRGFQKYSQVSVICRLCRIHSATKDNAQHSNSPIHVSSFFLLWREIWPYIVASLFTGSLPPPACQETCRLHKCLWTIGNWSFFLVEQAYWKYKKREYSLKERDSFSMLLSAFKQKVIF